jgi:hypothetical protein
VVRIPVLEGVGTRGIIARILDRWAAASPSAAGEVRPSGDRLDF